MHISASVRLAAALLALITSPSVAREPLVIAGKSYAIPDRAGFALRARQANGYVAIFFRLQLPDLSPSPNDVIKPDGEYFPRVVGGLIEYKPGEHGKPVAEQLANWLKIFRIGPDDYVRSQKGYKAYVSRFKTADEIDFWDSDRADPLMVFCTQHQRVIVHPRCRVLREWPGGVMTMYDFDIAYQEQALQIDRLLRAKFESFRIKPWPG